MAGEIRQSQVELVAEFASLPSRIGAVRHLKRGDVLPLELPGRVTARGPRLPASRSSSPWNRELPAPPPATWKW